MNKTGNLGSDPQENIIPILPAIIIGMVNLVLVIAVAFYLEPDPGIAAQFILIAYGIAGCAYIWAYYRLYTTMPNRVIYEWANSVIAGTALGLLIYLIPLEIDYLIHSMVLIAALSSAVVSGRAPSMLLIVIAGAFHFAYYFLNFTPLITKVIHAFLLISVVIVVETVQQVKALSQKQINRLEAANEISRQIVSTLDTRQLIALLNAALHNALDADTYYIGIEDNGNLQMQLFYDDGEYFHDIAYKLGGSLSGWVIKHQRPLFLPDLRKPLNLDDVNMVVIGKPKPSLSWMGVPMKGMHVNGIIAIASYRPRAFNRGDFELLISIAQRAALALDNTYHHALVEEEARLDSLTRVYNHGHFIQTLRAQAEACRSASQPLSLIMLDIDHFKQYNDSFGHAIGDEILVRLCNAIRSHIKHSDAVGRWGGEEFAISLPNADADQAILVAQRITQTLADFKFDHSKTFPVPTVSMGIAVFPHEAGEITKLIDLADKRLYIAKRRGRNQVEAALTV
ncbi:MAG: hypothetical protein DPW18_02790 [Chloroflexi bacterium]|nr:hypothetical protein [Chloroflexota bacterium]MDL1942950.1 sensor domain-containing diguanylate cyclase [Chloroflexi bacterium CFX2]